MKSSYEIACQTTVVMLAYATMGMTGGALAQVPSSALHPGSLNSGALVSSPAWNGPRPVAARPATTPNPPQAMATLRIIDPQDNAERSRGNFRIAIATPAAYANRLATVTVHQQVTAGSRNEGGISLPVVHDAKWDVAVSQLLQGWSPPATQGWFDPNLWFENVSGPALVEVSFAIPEHAERLTAQTHVTFAKLEVARGLQATKQPTRQSSAPSRRPVSLGPRP